MKDVDGGRLATDRIKSGPSTPVHHTPLRVICKKCGHQREDHTQPGQMRPWLMCEYPNCDCEDFQE